MMRESSGLVSAAAVLPVLMVLRVKGRAASAAVAATAGTSEDAARAVLEGACARGAVQLVGATGAYALTPDGRAEVAALVAAEAIDRTALATCYQEFLAVDGRLKRQVSAWQLLPHAARGAAGGTAMAAVRATASEARALAHRLAALVPRLASYADRLAAAERGLAAGDDRYVASPHVDSLHQVWFELHEDLLVTLDRERRT